MQFSVTIVMHIKRYIQIMLTANYVYIIILVV